MKKMFFALFVLGIGLMMCYPGEAAQRQVRESHTDASCSSCHVGQENPTQPGEISCKICHMSPDKVAQKTASMGKQNPHTSPHWGTTTPCWTCHKEHSTDVNYCLTCHLWDKAKK